MDRGPARMTEPLERIAAALERMAPAPLTAPDLKQADAFVWHVESGLPAAGSRRFAR